MLTERKQKISIKNVQKWNQPAYLWWVSLSINLIKVPPLIIGALLELFENVKTNENTNMLQCFTKINILFFQVSKSLPLVPLQTQYYLLHLPQQTWKIFKKDIITLSTNRSTVCLFKVLCTLCRITTLDFNWS